MSKTRAPVEITEEQRKLAAQWEEEQQKKEAERQSNSQKLELLKTEAAAVAKFLLEKVSEKLHRTQLIIKQAGGKMIPINCEYVNGKNLHFCVLENKAAILKMVPTMNSVKDMNGLAGISDSCTLIMGLVQFGAMNRVIPNRMQYTDPNDPDCKRPKSVEVLPLEHMVVSPQGFYIFQVEQGKGKTQLWLFICIALAMFFLLFRVWPEWLKVGVWYVSWYFLVFLVATAIVRAIIWFVIFHIGVDFWLFPNYFIDSDNILDSFVPVLSVERREDMFDIRMLLLRVCSAVAIFYGAQEFMKEPENLDQLLKGSGELWDEMYDWGQNKFMGTVDPNQQIEVKKSARQIYAEAFMDDENPMFRTNTQFADFADDDELREAYEAEQKLSAEELAKKRFDEMMDDDEDEDAESIDIDSADKADPESAADETAEVEEVDMDDLMDKLTGNFDDDDEEEEEEAITAESTEAEPKAAPQRARPEVIIKAPEDFDKSTIREQKEPPSEDKKIDMEKWLKDREEKRAAVAEEAKKDKEAQLRAEKKARLENIANIDTESVLLKSKEKPIDSPADYDETDEEINQRIRANKEKAVKAQRELDAMKAEDEAAAAAASQE